MPKKQSPQSTHGGHRPGAGRARHGDALKVVKAYTVSVDVAAYLASTGNASSAVTEIVEKSKGFREWKEAKGE